MKECFGGSGGEPEVKKHTHTHTDGKTEKHLPKYRAKAPWEAKGVLCPVVRDTTQRSLWVTA